MAFIVDTEEMTEVVVDGAVMNDVFVDGELVYSKRTLNLYMVDEGGFLGNDVDCHLGTSDSGALIVDGGDNAGFDITTTAMLIPGAHLLEFNYIDGDASYTHTVTNTSTLRFASNSNSTIGSIYEVVYLAAL